MKRRQFVQQSLLAGTGLVLVQNQALPRVASEATIEILVNEPIGRIAPEVYGHFTEHIGGVVYDGIWVGEDSKVPNIGGIRKELVDHLKRIKPGSMRWPGGCFADSYNWKDGIGSMANRPTRTNFWDNTSFLQKAPAGPVKYEPNHFGTNEFLRFCQLVDAKPYLAANARTLSPQDLIDWMEYCNGPAGSTSYANLRVDHGRNDPYNVVYWGIGNESWGCGGDMLPEDYAMAYRKFTSFIPRFGLDLQQVGVGPSDSWNNRDLEWTRRFFTKLLEPSNTFTDNLDKIQGYSLHFYCGSTGESSIDYTDEDWYELIWRADRMETIIKEHWEVIGGFDSDRRIKLYVDEWGAWHPQKTQVHNTHLFGQTSTMRDALIAALTLDTFNRHADKVVMGNVAQLINNLHSLFLAHEDQFVVTPNFYVYELYAAHQGAESLQTRFSAPSTSSERQLWGLAGSASRKGKNAFLTVVNPDINKSLETEIMLQGAKIKSARGKAFRSSNIRDHNNLKNPNGVAPPIDFDLKLKKGELVHSFAPASVTGLRLEAWS